MDELIGKKVTLFCLNFIYNGVLVSVNKKEVKLKDASIVYETGSHTDSNFKDIQSLDTEFWYLSRGCIESFGEMKND